MIYLKNSEETFFSMIHMKQLVNLFKKRNYEMPQMFS